jgi:four helix bundle protein
MNWKGWGPMLQNFRTHTLAVEFYRECKRANIPAYARDQLRRAAFSIALNLAEGAGRRESKERIRFYSIALGSLREAQSIIQMESLENLRSQADKLGANLYKLVYQ